jgi:hypothetical protein
MKFQPTIAYQTMPKPASMDSKWLGWFDGYKENLRRLYEQLVKSLSTVTYDITIFRDGTPTASQTMFVEVTAHDLTFDSNFLGAKGTALIAATAQTTFNVRKAGTIIGHIVYAAGQTTPTFDTTGGAEVFYPTGTTFKIDAPVTPDATLSGVSWVFVASKDF